MKRPRQRFGGEEVRQEPEASCPLGVAGLVDGYWDEGTGARLLNLFFGRWSLGHKFIWRRGGHAFSRLQGRCRR